LNETYDRQTLEVMKRILSPDSSGVDMGAHHGSILRHMVTIAPNGRHHAFEPLPHLAADLREKFPAVAIHEVALGDRSGHADFLHIENDPAYSGLRRRIYDRPDPQITTIQVKVVALDEVIPADQHIAFMKIDLEGGEYHALKGAARTIQRWQPVFVFEAGCKSTGLYGVTPVDMYHLITQTFGYQISTMGRWLNGVNQSFPREEFCGHWDNGPDYFFLATPAAKASVQA